MTLYETFQFLLPTCGRKIAWLSARVVFGIDDHDELLRLNVVTPAEYCAIYACSETARRALAERPE